MITQVLPSLRKLLIKYFIRKRTHNQFLLFLFNAAYLRGEAANINIIIFGFTCPGLESTIHLTQGQHTITPLMWSVSKSGFIVKNIKTENVFHSPIHVEHW
jgi:hypothetical protein